MSNIYNKDGNSNIVKEAKSISIILFFALLFRVFVMEPYYIPSPSMKDTLLKGDYVFATKYSYGYSKYSMLFFHPDFIKDRILAQSPERGDIVIFQPPHDKSQKYIKRLIGMPGDKVQIKNSVLYLNDAPIPREEIDEYKDKDGTYTRYIETLPNGIKYHILQITNRSDAMIHEANNTREFIIPAGHYFFLGDNRNESGDSRFQVGYVPFENFIAKARFFYFSTSEELFSLSFSLLEQLKQPYYWVKSIRIDRLFKNIYSIQ